MIRPTCPACAKVIPREDVHVANDVAYCRACHLSHSLAALTHQDETKADVDLNHPPPGTWNRREDMGGVVLGATHRSLGAAVGLLAISLFWNGIVSIFVSVAAASTLNLLQMPVPSWFPAPEMNKQPMGLGITVFLWIFLTPFMVIGIGLLGAFLSSLAGRTEVTIFNGEGTIFSGIGPIGRRRRFNTREVTEVRIDSKHWRSSNGGNRNKTYIVIEDRHGKQIKFGSMLREDRRQYIKTALRKALLR